MKTPIMTDHFKLIILYKVFWLTLASAVAWFILAFGLNIFICGSSTNSPCNNCEGNPISFLCPSLFRDEPSSHRSLAAGEDINIEDEADAFFDFSSLAIAITTFPRVNRDKLIYTVIDAVRRGCPQSEIHIFSGFRGDDEKNLWKLPQTVLDNIDQVYNHTVPRDYESLYKSSAANYVNMFSILANKEHLVVLEDDVLVAENFCKRLQTAVHGVRKYQKEKSRTTQHADKEFLLNLYNGKMLAKAKKEQVATAKFMWDPFRSAISANKRCVKPGGFSWGSQGLYYSGPNLMKALAEHFDDYLNERKGFRVTRLQDITIRAFTHDDVYAIYSPWKRIFRKRNPAFPKYFDVFSLSYSLVQHKGEVSSIFSHHKKDRVQKPWRSRFVAIDKTSLAERPLRPDQALLKKYHPRFHNARDFIDDMPQLEQQCFPGL